MNQASLDFQICQEDHDPLLSREDMPLLFLVPLSHQETQGNLEVLCLLLIQDLLKQISQEVQGSREDLVDHCHHAYQESLQL